MGPKGVNGSQGPPGLPGVTGRMGSPWNVSGCQYRYKKKLGWMGGVAPRSRVTLREDDHKVRI